MTFFGATDASGSEDARLAKTDEDPGTDSRAPWERILCVAVLILVPLFGFCTVLSGSESFFISSDNVNQAYPWYQKLAIAIHAGYLPIWDANVLAGHSFVGEFQTAIFYPLNILWVWLFGTSDGISVKALELLVLLHYALASAGLYLLCRRLALSRIGSAVGGIIFAYTGAFAARASGQTCIFFGDAWIPIAVLLIIMALERRSIKLAAAAGAAIGVEVLAGHLQPPSIAGLLVFGILAVSVARTRQYIFVLKAYAAVVFTALFIGSPQVVLGFQYLRNSYRWVGADEPVTGTHGVPFATYLATALRPDQFLSVFDPWHHDVSDANTLFIGSLPLVLLVLAAAFKPLRQGLCQLLSPIYAIVIMAVFSILMLLGPITPIAKIVYYVPFASAAVRELGRYSIILELFLALATAAALDTIASTKLGMADFRKPVAIGGVVVCVAYAVFLMLNYAGGAWLGLLAMLVLLTSLFLTKTLRAPIVMALIAIEIVLNLPHEAQSSSSPTYPPRSYASDAMLALPEACFPGCRLSIIGNAFPANIGDVYRIQTLFGNGATMYAPYFELLGNGGFDPHGFVQDVLGVKYIISDHALQGFNLLATDKERGFLYMRPGAFPRAFSYEALTAKTLERNDVRFTIESYNDLHQVFDVTVPRAETIVFAEQFYPGWVAIIDGKRAPMLTAAIGTSDPILRSVNVEAGTHTVEFAYPRV